MPKASASLDAAKQLLEYVQGNVPTDSSMYPNVAVGEFNHSGMKMRGLSATKNFHRGEQIISLPEKFVATSDVVQGHRFDGASSSKTAMALWLAEQRTASSSRGLDQDFWTTAIRSYPNLAHFESIGLPLTASDNDLDSLEGLPGLGSIPGWVRRVRGQLAQAQAMYNANPEGHQPLKWEDVLWARIILSAYTLGTDRPNAECTMHLAPVADLLDHDVDSNAHFECNQFSRNIEIVADRNITPGEELTITYKRNALANFQYYGIFDKKSDAFFFTPQECSKLKKAHLDRSEAPLAQGASRFINLWCPEPGMVMASSSATKAAMSTGQPTDPGSPEANHGISTWPDEDAEIEKMAELRGEKLAEEELANMPAAAVAKLVEEEQNKPVSSLAASGLPFSADPVKTATMSQMVLMSGPPKRCKRQDAVDFLRGPNLDSFASRRIETETESSTRQSYCKVHGLQIQRSCLGIPDLGRAACLLLSH